MQNRAYLDWNATAPLRREAREAMMAACDTLGNPSAVHGEGRAARRLLEDARQAVAAAVGADAHEVIFTSGATEANSLALAPGMKRGSAGAGVQRLLISAIEHSSVLAGGRFANARLGTLSVDRSGRLDLEALSAELRQAGPVLVSVMLANNETGAIQPIEEIAGLVREAGGLLHVDAVAAFGKIPFNFKTIGADLLSVSAHKIGGPMGVGALIVADELRDLSPLLRGGGQEKRRRAGTENLAGIVGFGAAVGAMTFGDEIERMVRLRDQLERGLRQVERTIIFSADVPRLPNTTLAGVPGMNAETAVIGLDLAGVAVSSGSACSSGKIQPSHVLEAMGYGPELAKSAIRFSLGWETTEADIDRALKAWRKLAGALLRGHETVLERF